MTTAVSSLALLLATLSPATSGDDLVPGRAENYELSAINVEGTKWEGETLNDGLFILRFERDGVLCYTTRTGTFRNGTWKQNGTSIYLEMNGRYAEYRGEIRGDRILGKAGNIKGLAWTWNVKRTGPIPMKELEIITRPKR